MRSVEKYQFCIESEKNTQPVARVGEKIPSALRVKMELKFLSIIIIIEIDLLTKFCISNVYF